MINLIYPSDVPAIPKTLTPEEAIHQLIPTQFAHFLQVEIVNKGVELTFLKGNRGLNKVIISERIFNPSKYNFSFPSFVFDISRFSETPVDYRANRLILNQNELLYMALHHRFTMLAQWEHHYVNLVKSDVKAISLFSDYLMTTSVNAKLKTLHSIVVLCPWKKDEDGRINLVGPIGDLLGKPSFDKVQVERLFRDLPIQPASESMASESGKFVMCEDPESFYTATGYGVMDGQIKTMFPPKSNIPARFKSHVLADAYHFVNPSKPIYLQDAQVDPEVGDKTLLNAVVVFDHINEVSGRLLCGEIEAAASLTTKLVYKDETIRDRFEAAPVAVGDVLLAHRGNVTIGTNLKGEPVKVMRCKRAVVKAVEWDEVAKFAKISLTCTKEMGAGRIFSHTGLKGVTKPRPYIGEIIAHIETENGLVEKRLSIDLIAGMNSTKAAQNTIVMAQAALTHQVLNSEELIDSLDEAQVNAYAGKLAKCVYRSPDFEEYEVMAGIVQISVNELAETYSHVKLQNFQPEAGRHLYQGGHQALFEEIWKEGVSEEDKGIIFELQKIWCDQEGVYAIEDDIPVFTPTELKALNVFAREDLIFDLNTLLPYTSKLLDEEYNKGWALDLRYRNGGIIRMPSAKLLNTLSGEMIDGSYKYPVLLMNVSQMIDACITVNDRGLPNVGYLNDRELSPKLGTKSLVARYLSNVRNALYAPRSKSDVMNIKTNMIEMLLKPKLLGINMKQVADVYVPEGTMVILDRDIYERLSKQSDDFYQDNGYFNALCVRNPVLWRSQTQSTKLWGPEQFAEHLMKRYDITLERYLYLHHCRDLILMNPEDAISQQSDCDGDIMPVFVPGSYKAQVMLDGFKSIGGSARRSVDGIVMEEISWINDYRAGEVEANDKLDLSGKKRLYKLHSLPFYSEDPTVPSYASYFANSIVAKADVGPATINNWTLNALLEIYKKECDAGNVWIKKSKGEEAVSIDEAEINYISFMYSRLVQDMVVRGIKHSEDGSASFVPFLLGVRMLKKDRKLIASVLTNIGITPIVIGKFFHFIHWCVDTGYLSSVIDFITLHNSGREPRDGFNEDQFKVITRSTFHGRLLKEFYGLREHVEQMTEKGFSYATPEAVAEQSAIPSFLTPFIA